MGNNIFNATNIRKTVNYLRKNGIRHAYYAAKERIEEEKRSDYIYEEPKEAALEMQRNSWKNLPYRFSIIVPAYETKAEYMRELIDSVRRQSYERWELIIADASTSSGVEEIVAEYQEIENERRIRYIRLIENRGISENTNVGIEAAEGDYIGLLDHDDVLTPDALYEIAYVIHKSEEKGERPTLIYSDEDKFTDNIVTPQAGNGYDCRSGNTARIYKDVNRKYDFNLDLILSNNYICHFMVVEAALMKSLKLQKKYDGAQDYNLVLRIIDKLLESKSVDDVIELNKMVLHVPRVLYHWRCHENSTAENTASKTYAYEAGKAALEDFCKKRGWKTQVCHSLHLGFYQIGYLPDIFSVRQEVGIIGGRILDGKNKIVSGIYNEKGERLYVGVHKEYSGGNTHKAALMQDCAAVDIRCVRVCSALQPLFEQITSVTYCEKGEQKLADVSGINCDEEGYRKLSMELGRAAAKMGYLVVWNPLITIKMK
ncbi:MAG: glycosyltransferase [Lachnospiraceae bacterium]|nr:glycosyltransferase [Lachnospiraceae bacterium]